MKVINFFGAPGVGKTTKTLELTSLMKKTQLDVEPSLEIVKEYIYSGANVLLAYQNFIFAQQERQLRILEDSKENEFVITDAPLLNNVFYAPKKYPVFFKELVFEIFNSYDNVNFFVRRTHPYSHQGRIHNEKESDKITNQMYAFLINYNVPFIEINSTDDIMDVYEMLMEYHRVSNYEQTKKKRDK